MNAGQLNSIHWEYQQRLSAEFHLLMAQSTLAEIIFMSDVKILDDESAPYHSSLLNLFSCSFESMALSLARVWEEDKHVTTISLPNLVKHFKPQNHFGCSNLFDRQPDRLKFEALKAHPLRPRLRVARTEFLAHAVQLGKSTDRNGNRNKKLPTDIAGKRDFDIKNGELIDFCNATLELLFAINDRLSLEKWKNGSSLERMRKDARTQHINLLRYLIPIIE